MEQNVGLNHAGEPLQQFTRLYSVSEWEMRKLRDQQKDQH